MITCILTLRQLNCDISTMKNVTLIIITIILLSGCEPKIDASSEDSLKASVDKMSAKMSESEKEKFSESIILAALDGQSLLEVDPESMYNKLDGMTVDEILTKAEELRLIAEKEEAERKKKQRAAQLKRLQLRLLEIEETIIANKKNQELLEKLIIIQARVYWNEGGFSWSPVLDLSFKNETNVAISRIYANGIVKSPGREIPWLEETFNFRPDGGLEPGEELNTKLNPNSFGPWGNIPKDRKDIILDVSVYKLEGAGEKIIAEYKELDFQEELNAVVSEIKNIEGQK